MRGATDLGPRGGSATAQRLLADADATRPCAECDIYHVRCRGAKSFVDDLGLSRGVVLSRAVRFCDLLRLSPLTRRFVRFRRTSLSFFYFPETSAVGRCLATVARQQTVSKTFSNGTCDLFSNRVKNV